MKTKYSHLLLDETPCYELSKSDIEGHHDLCDLAKADGHASLRSCLNDWNAWGETVAEVAAMLYHPITPEPRTLIPPPHLG